MYGMEIYERVRLAVMADGMSKREAARRFGIDRKTVDKICVIGSVVDSVETGFMLAYRRSVASGRMFSADTYEPNVVETLIGDLQFARTWSCAREAL